MKTIILLRAIHLFFRKQTIESSIRHFIFWFLLLVAGASFGQTIMFDDFTYTGTSDPQLPVFNKWQIINGASGPPEGAMYKRDNITFITDPGNSNNKLMTMSATVNGSSKATTHSRIETGGFEYFEGTYSARIYLSDVPFTYKDANIQTFYTIVGSDLAGNGAKYSELDVIEYMAADKWGTAPDKPVAYVTSWNRYIADPWQAWKRYFAYQKSYAGWHTVTASCTDKVNVKYWIDDTYLGSQATTDNDGSSVYPRSNMQVAFANWIWNNVVGSSTADRTTTMQVDWTLYYKNTELTPAQVNAQVQTFRSQGIQRRNLAGQTYVTNTCPVPAQPGTIAGNTAVNSGSSQTYTIAAVANATSYTWTLPSGWSGNSTTTSITTTAGNAGGTISVTANNNCGASLSRTLAVTINCTVPAQPGVISGNTTVASGSNQTYSVAAVSGATSYTWTLPSGWSGTSTNTSITTTAGSNGGTISVKATNACGASAARTLTVTVSAPVQSPYGGTAWPIPGTIEAENYDLGGQGVAFNEVTAANEGGAYRTDAVDIEVTTGGGFNLGYVFTDEWLEYTVNVTAAGNYKIEARVAAMAAGKTFRVEMDGSSIGTFSVPNTAGWQNWQLATLNNIALTAGQKIMRIYATSTDFNLDNVKFTSSVSNQAPSVNITSPANNATFNAGSTITINANASDNDGTISKVEFFRGAVKIGEDASAPYTINWTNATAGAYALTAIATDNGGLSTTSAVINITVITVSAQTPYGGTPWNIPGKIETENYDLGGQGIAFNDLTTGNSGNAFRTDAVDIEACNDAGLGYNIGWIQSGEWLEYTVNVTTAGVYTLQVRAAAITAGRTFHIELDGQNISGSMMVPNTGAWQNWQTVTATTPSLTVGQKVLRIAMDGAEFNLNSVNFISTIPNNGPTASISSPSANASFTEGSTITINADAADADGSVSKVEFFRGSTKIGEDLASPFTIGWTGATAGSYSLTVKATDDKGAITTSSPVAITVTGLANNPPTVSISSPENNASFNEAATVSISANAADSDGTISKVEFFRGTTKIGEDAIAPYSVSWTGVTAGTYSLTAKATDNKGAVITSAIVTVTVNATTNGCTGIPQYIENGGYVAGSKVQNAGQQFECKTWPASGWCNGASWAYAPGTGSYWQDAWTLLGNCSSSRSASANINGAADKVIGLFPNPTTNSSLVKLTSANAANAEVVVLNAMGKEIYKTVLNNNQESTIDLSGMSNGIYMIRISAGDNVWMEKLIKE